jgi:hypothetical protein
MHSLGFQLNVILTFNENIQIFRFKTKKEEKEEFFLSSFREQIIIK